MTSPGVVGGITLSTVNESVYAGTSTVHLIDGGSPGSETYFAVVFNNVVFNGAQFKFYISTNGLSEINTTAGETTDIPFGPTFYVANFTHNCATACFVVNGTNTVPGIGKTYYYQGTYTSDTLVAGIIPIQISPAYEYIKVYDGTSTAVAVAKEYIVVLPGISVNPTSGPAGLSVSVSGGGFSSAAAIDINYSYPYVQWHATSPTVETGTWIFSSSITNHHGWFTTSGDIIDTKQSFNPVNYGIISSVPITLIAVNASKPSQAFTSGSGDATYTEWTRIIQQVSSYYSPDSYADVETAAAGHGYGNGTHTQPGYAYDVPPIDAYVTGTLGIEGNFTYSGSTVTVTLGTSTKSVTSNVAWGHFVINITVPVLAVGYNNVTVTSNGVKYIFSIYVEPTVVLSPDQGPTSGCNGWDCTTNGTTVHVTVYGFPSDKLVWIYWESITYGDGLAFNLLNGTTGSSGSFVSCSDSSCTFTVPDPTFGGIHYVDVVVNSSSYSGTPTYQGHNNTISDIQDYSYAYAEFTVTPSLEIASGDQTINSNVPGFINVNVQGLAPDYLYMIQIDHSLYSYIGGIEPECEDSCYYWTGFNGNGQFNFTSAGFTPGLHQVEITPYLYCWTKGECDGTYDSNDYYESNYTTPQAWTYFNVTTTGDYISNEINGISSSVTHSVDSALASWTTTLNNIQTAVTTNIPTDISNSQAAITSAITNAQTAIASDITTATTTLSGDISSATTTLSSAIAGVQSTASSTLTQATTAATEASSASSGSSTAQTYVLVVAVLAAITLVLELAILVRKLS